LTRSLFATSNLLMGPTELCATKASGDLAGAASPPPRLPASPPPRLPASPPSRLLIHPTRQKPAVHREQMSSDEARRLGREKNCGARELVRLTEASHRRSQQ
jgi:hypothetical protein